MNEALSAILWGIPTFSLLVVLHEGGHFAVARAFGIKVHEFMIGLPGPALRFHGKKTTYGITAVPLGGYVRIAGMEPGTEDPLMPDALAYVTRLGSGNSAGLSYALDIDVRRADTLLATLADWDAIDRDPDDEDTFLARAEPEAADRAVEMLAEVRTHTYRGLPTWKRIAVLAAGVVVNLVTALAVFVLVLSLWGPAVPTLTLENIQQGGPSAAVGLKAGDVLVAIDGTRLADWTALLATIAKHKPGDRVSVVASRGDVQTTYRITLGRKPDGGAKLGVISKSRNVPVPLTKAVGQSFFLIGLVFKTIAGLFIPSQFKATMTGVTGIVGASVAVSEAAQAGPLDYAFIVALLSLSLGAINIVPLPPLDGGKIGLEIIERIAGKPLPKNISIGITSVGAALLFTLIGYLMYADIVRYVVNGG